MCNVKFNAIEFHSRSQLAKPSQRLAFQLLARMDRSNTQQLLGILWVMSLSPHHNIAESCHRSVIPRGWIVQVLPCTSQEVDNKALDSPVPIPRNNGIGSFLKGVKGQLVDRALGNYETTHWKRGAYIQQEIWAHWCATNSWRWKSKGHIKTHQSEREDRVYYELRRRHETKRIYHY